MDQDLITYLDQRFEAIDSRFVELEARLVQKLNHEVGGLREEMNRRFEEAADTARHTMVVLEDLRDEVHLIAEAHLGLREQVVERESEVDLKISQTEASIEPYYRDLNHRVQGLEGWRDRQQDDVTDAVRKVLEKARRRREAG